MADRHNISISDELWARIQKAAREESVKQDRTISASEWLRERVLKELEGAA